MPAAAFLHFNRGLISRLALARADLKRTAFSAETMVNWIPRVLGSMMLRPGLRFLGGINSAPKIIPFIFATEDTALIELTEAVMRVWVNDGLVTRAAVGSTVTNGNFGDAALTGWSSADEAGSTSSWAVGSYLQLLGNGTATAIRDQPVPVALADRGTEHALRIIVTRGPVILRVGSAAAGDEYIAETELATGIHSLAFVPTGANFYIRIMGRVNRITLVDSIQVESAGVMQIPAPWTGTDLKRLRWDQSADVVFVACKGQQQRKIERRSGRSWSLVGYYSNNGPFRTENLGPIMIATSALNGNVTLTASKALFKSTQVGGLIRHRSTGQRVSTSIAAANTFTNTVRVVGVGEQRRFAWSITGVWVGTVTLQRSVGTVGFWEDVATRTGNADESDNDGLDNQVIYYRIGFKAGNYTSGTAVCTITYTLGSITGLARITAFGSATTVSAEILADFGSLDDSLYWSEGSWSDRRGWPTSVAFYEGRLWWAGKNSVWGSVSDAYDSFDSDFEGDAGPINRSIGSGPVDTIHWLLPLQRLLVGSGGSEISVRSTSFDEPLSPTNFNMKDASTQGSAEVAGVKVDHRGIFVQRGGTRVYELALDNSSFDYSSSDLTALIPEGGNPSIIALAVQRQPDTRIHCVKSDGTVLLGVIDHAENTLAWQYVTTDGDILDVAVLPTNGVEDAVYYVVRRTIGATGVTSLSVTPGTGYTSVPLLFFSGGDGENASGTVALTLVSLAVSAGGASYVAGDFLTSIGGTSSITFVVRVDTVDGAGAVLTATLMQGGNYTVLPSNAVSTTGSSSGAGCTLTCTWGLGTATVTGTGGSYASAPDVTLLGGGGTGGAITAAISTTTQTGHYLERWALESECVGGSANRQADSFVYFKGAPSVVAGGGVVSLSVTPGTGFISQPALTFVGDGSGAAATIELAYDWAGGASIPGVLGFYALANFGGGYSVGDVLTLVGGTYTRPAKFRVLSVFSGGQIYADDNNKLEVVDYGSYSVVPGYGFGSSIAVTGGTGSGATFRGWWALGEATITAPGANYTSPPTVTVVGGGGTGGAVSAALGLGISTVPTASSTITGLDHLEGKEVIVWGDGEDLSPLVVDVQTTYTVTGGQVNLDTDVGEAIVGLPYTADWKSTKLGTAEPLTLGQRKRISQLGLILADVHAKGVRFGPSFDRLNPLPDIQASAYIPYATVHTAYDFDLMAFPGGWDTDSRLCLRAMAPRPCKVLAVVMAIEGGTKS